VDKMYRLANGWNWWENEQLSKDEQIEIINNLKYKKWDIVLAHTCPYEFMPREAFLPDINQRDVDNSTEEFLQEIYMMNFNAEWYCGHWHIDKDVENVHFVKDRVIKLEEV